MTLPGRLGDEYVTIIDTRGHRCPIPTLRLRRALVRAKVGEIVILWSDDPMARIDVPHFARAAGHTVTTTTAEGSAIRFDVRKGV